MLIDKNEIKESLKNNIISKFKLFAGVVTKNTNLSFMVLFRCFNDSVSLSFLSILSIESLLQILLLQLLHRQTGRRQMLGLFLLAMYESPYFSSLAVFQLELCVSLHPTLTQLDTNIGFYFPDQLKGQGLIQLLQPQLLSWTYIVWIRYSTGTGYG